MELENWELFGLDLGQEHYPWGKSYKLTEAMLLEWIFPECSGSQARELVQQFGSLPHLINAKREELVSLSEVEERFAFRLNVLRELILRVNNLQKWGLYREQNILEVEKYVETKMRQTTEEEMWVMVLDEQGYVLEWVRVWREGETWLSGEKIWQIVKEKEGAQRYFVARSNKGDEWVTLEDEVLYQFLRKSEKQEGIKLMDYLVVSEKEAINLNYWN